MSGFKRGDVVVCVDPWLRDGPHHGDAVVSGWLRHQAIYRVAASGAFYGVGAVKIEGDPNLYLQPNLWWEADRFRHLPKADPAFTEAMRALRPEKEGVA